MLEVMAGNDIKATAVTWKVFHGGHKLAPEENLTRVKVRGSEIVSLDTLLELEKWVNQTMDLPLENHKPSRRATHGGGKRG